MILNEFRTFVGDMKKVAEEIIPKLELESLSSLKDISRSTQVYCVFLLISI